jgi:hypothetical protein
MLVAAMLALGGTTPGLAHGDHGDEVAPANVGPMAPRFAAKSETFELVGVAHGKLLTLYLDRFRDNSPVADARLEVGTADGKSIIATASGEGTYRVTAEWVGQPGHHDLVFTITAGSDVDLLAGTLDIPRVAETAPPASGVLSLIGGRQLADPRLAFVLGIVVAVVARYGRLLLSARRRSAGGGIRAALRLGKPQPVRLALAAALIGVALLLIGHAVLAHEGHDDAAVAPAGDLTVSATAPRRLLDGSVFLPKTSQSILHVRTMVTAPGNVSRSTRMVGQVMPDPGTSGVVHATIRGRLEPIEGRWPRVGQKVELDQPLAAVVPVVNPIDRGIVLQQLAQIDRDIETAQARLTELSADKKATAGAVDGARGELANLARRRDAIALVLRDRDNLKALLRAPSSGVISASYAAAGQIVDEQTKLFEVVNPKRLWVEGFAYDMTGLGDVLDADAVAASGRNYRLKFISRGPQLERQTIPLYFEVENPDAALSVGSLLTVLVQTGENRSGLIVPRSAVVQDASGQWIVWRHDYAEGFIATPVRTEPIDGENVLVVAGLQPDARVVVDGADLLTEIR